MWKTFENRQEMINLWRIKLSINTQKVITPSFNESINTTNAQIYEIQSQFKPAVHTNCPPYQA